MSALPIVADADGAARPTSCPGTCCKGIAIFGFMPEGRVSLSPEQLRAQWLAWRSKEPATVIVDIDMIYPMLIPLGLHKSNPAIPNGPAWTEPAHFYACKHLDADNLCSIYEDRPAMCRTFPDHQACTTPGCGEQPPAPPAQQLVSATDLPVAPVEP